MKDEQKEKITEKKLPFEPEHFLNAVGDASKRTRRILLFMIFASALILMAGINSIPPEYNWFSSKTELNKNIFNYIVFPDMKIDSSYYYQGKSIKILPILDLKSFIDSNEMFFKHKLDSNDSNKINTIINKVEKNIFFMLKNPKLTPVYGESFEKRLKKYSKIEEALRFTIKHQIYSKEILSEYITKLDESEVEHISLVRVPILGISFHINYIGFYSGLTLFIFYLLLYFALKREHINIKMAFRRGWTDVKHHHYYFYEYAAMQQVLSVTVKLFSPKKSNWLSSIIGYGSITFPLFVYVIIVLIDYNTIDVGLESNEFLTKFSFVFSIFFLISILLLCILVVNKWTKMDKLWSNQALEFNFEYILECLKIDINPDLLDFNIEQPINEKNLDDVKKLWHYYVLRYTSNRISFTEAIDVFSNFINCVLKSDFEKVKNIKYNKELVDKNWDDLLLWYEKFGKKNVESSFRKSFKAMVVQRMQDIH